MTSDQTANKRPMTVRLVTEADGADLNTLYNQVFNEERPLAVWRWKFPEGLAEDWPVVYSVAEIDAQIIGQYAAQIRLFNMQGQPVRFALVMDNIVAEEYRRGYPAQKEMYTLARDTAQANNVPIAYGFPNQRAYKVGKRLLGYQDIAVLPELFYRLSWRPAIIKRLPWLPAPLVTMLDTLCCTWGRILETSTRSPAGAISVKEIDNFTNDFDLLWERLKSRRTICAQRTSRYLNWRFGRDEIIHYRKLVARNQENTTVGYLVTRSMQVSGDRVGFLVDFMYETQDALVALLHHALDIMRRDKVDYVSVMVSPETQEVRDLETFGFALKDGYGGRPLVTQDLNQSLPFDVILDPSQWYLTYGDSDLI